MLLILKSTLLSLVFLLLPMSIFAQDRNSLNTAEVTAAVYSDRHVNHEITVLRKEVVDTNKPNMDSALIDFYYTTEDGGKFPFLFGTMQLTLKPIENILTISVLFTDSFTGQLQILDMNEQVLQETIILPTKYYQEQLSIADLPVGIYYAKVINSRGQYLIKKFAKG